MYLHIRLILFVFFIITFHEHEAIAENAPEYSSVVIPVNKHIDAPKPLYSVQVIENGNEYQQYIYANLLIDLDAPFIWHDCSVGFNILPGRCVFSPPCTEPVSCKEYQCTDVRTTYSYTSPSCPPVTNDSMLTDWGICSCKVNVVSPVTGLCDQALLNYDSFKVNTSNGRNAFTDIYSAYPNAACAPSSLFQSFPASVNGVMAFSLSPYALPAYLARGFKRIMALCLPSNISSRGVLFYGNGPYYLLPHNIDIRSFLSYTPLIKHPNSFGYFISIKAVVVKKRSIDIPKNVSTKISTLEPYTVLRTDIYKPVIRRFSKVTKRIPLAKPVAPFGLCFKTSNNGLRVPDIEFSFEGGKKWSISTSNSMKQVTKDVACLAFVDGGATREPAIVIGTFQYEDNLVVFDLENSSFGFSSSLLRKKTSCSNFNYTVV